MASGSLRDLWSIGCRVEHQGRWLSGAGKVPGSGSRQKRDGQ